MRGQIASLPSATMADFKTLFTDNKQVDSYAKYRPVYTPPVVNLIANNFARVKAASKITPDIFTGDTTAPAASVNVRLAVDAACGSGQLAQLLTEAPISAKHVMGFDPSAAQIASASAHQRVSYIVGEVNDTPQLVASLLSSLGPEAAAELGFSPAASEDGGPTGSVDLITAAQAFHWFEFGRVYDLFHAALSAPAPSEGETVATSPGLLAVVSYDNPLLSNAVANTVVNTWLYDEVLGPYWSPRRHLVTDRYETVHAALDHSKWVSHRYIYGDAPWVATHPDQVAASQQPGSRVTVLPESSGLCMSRRMPIVAFRRYLESWSAYATWRAKHTDAVTGALTEEDPLDVVQRKLAEIYGAEDAEVDVTYPVHIILAAPLK